MGKKATNTDEINPALTRLVGNAAAARPQTPPAESRLETRDGAGKGEQAADIAIASERNISDATARRVRPVASSSLNVNRKVMFTETEAKRNEEITDLVSSCFGGKVTYSQITRAMWSVLAGAEDAIRDGAKRQPRRSFPSKGNAVAMAEYEEAVAEFLATAMKRS